MQNFVQVLAGCGIRRKTGFVQAIEEIEEWKSDPENMKLPFLLARKKISTLKDLPRMLALCSVLFVFVGVVTVIIVNILKKYILYIFQQLIPP